MKKSLALIVLSFFIMSAMSFANSPTDPPITAKKELVKKPTLYSYAEDHSTRKNKKYRSSRSGFEIFASDVFKYNFSFKIGGGHLYSLVNISSDRVWPWNYKRSNPNWAFGVGLGLKGRILGLPLRTEVAVNHINEEEFFDYQVNAFGQARFLIDIPLGCGGISIGPTFNLHASEIKNPDTDELVGSAIIPDRADAELSDDLGIYKWVGFTVGYVF